MGLPEPRPDLGLREGYHSPQMDVAVRLNTNESPLPPPPEWLDELAEELRRIAFNRYPDRQATELRAALADLHQVRPDQVFCANGSNEVLQSLCLAYGGPGRSVAVFEPTYALHSHIAHLTGTSVVEGGRGPDFSLDLGVVEDVVHSAHPVITFLCSPNNPTGMAEDLANVRAVLELAPGLVVVDEAYGQFADWSALSLVDDAVPLVVTRTFSKTWSMAAARLGYLVGPAPVVATLERVALPYHLDAIKQAAGRLAVRFVGRNGAACRPHSPRTAADPRGFRCSAARGLAVPIELHPVPARAAQGRRSMAGAARTEHPGAQHVVLARPFRMSEGHGGHARGKRPVPRRSHGDPLMSAGGRQAERRRVTKETSIDVRLLIDGEGAVSVDTGLPFFDHMVSQLGKHAGFDLSVKAAGDLHVDAHHTVEDVGILLGESIREALGDKAGVRRFASIDVPLDEALIAVALDLRAGPI